MEGNILVHKTAILVLYMRSLYSKPNSVTALMAKKLNAAGFVREFVNEVASQNNLDPEEIFSELQALSPIIEARTAAINKLAAQTGLKRYWCFGAGLCPTAFEITADHEVCFHHTDISEDLLNFMSDFANEFCERKRKLHFVRLDVLNEEQMIRLPWGMDFKPWIIYSAGMLQYFNIAQKREFFRLLAYIIHRTSGSVFITVDLSTKDDFDRLFSLRPSARIAAELVSGMSGENLEENAFKDEAERERMLADEGLAARIIPQAQLIANQSMHSLNIEGIDVSVAERMIATRKVFLVTQA